MLTNKLYYNHTWFVNKILFYDFLIEISGKKKKKRRYFFINSKITCLPLQVPLLACVSLDTKIGSVSGGGDARENCIKVWT